MAVVTGVGDGTSADVLLRAAVDAMVDPQALVEVVRDGDGSVVDFTFREVNPAASTYLRRPAEALIGTRLTDAIPALAGSGLLGLYVECVETGVPLEIEDFAFFSERYHQVRWFDLRAARAGTDWLSMLWRDVTDRYLSQRRVAASEEHFRLLAENSSDAVLHARDGRVVWASPSIEQVLGYPPDYWAGRELREAVPPGDLAQHEQRMALLAAGQEVQRRFQLVDKDGVLHWIHAHGRRFYDAQGQPDGFVSALRLIDDEVAAEQALEESRRETARADARYRDLMKNTIVPAALVGMDGRFSLANPAMCNFLGYDEATLTGMAPADVTAPEDVESGAEGIANLMAGRIDSYRATKQYIHAHGHRLWGELSLSCIRTPDGQVENLVGQVLDITEQVQLRRRQAEINEQFRLLMENSLVASAMTTLEGRFVTVNEAMCQFLGCDAETLLTKNWQEFVPEDDMPGQLQEVSDMLAGRRPSIKEVRRYLRADGRSVWGELLPTVLRDATGSPQHIVAQIVDVTTEVAARAEVEEARRQKEMADALYRRSVDSAAVGMCLVSPAGGFV